MNENELNSDYFTTYYNLSHFVPMRSQDTLAFNLFYSDAFVIKKGETDYATYQLLDGLNCQAIPEGTERDSCLATEEKYIDERIAHNNFGTATSLGGTQRLRSYANGRFYAGKALSYGSEYRWNLTDERTPFDLIIAKGIRTGVQLSAFIDGGTVSDTTEDLFKDHKYSYGVGMRMVLEGLVIRADIANGDEGSEFILFLGYPWNMFSVDNPG